MFIHHVTAWMLGCFTVMQQPECAGMCNCCGGLIATVMWQPEC